MPTPNKERGEVLVELKDSPLILRPTFDAIVKIEGETGMSVTRLARSLIEGDSLGIGVMTAIIFHGAKAAGSTLDRAAIGELVVRTGIGKITQPVVEFVTAYLVGDSEMGEEKAPAKGSKAQ